MLPCRVLVGGLSTPSRAPVLPSPMPQSDRLFVSADAGPELLHSAVANRLWSSAASTPRLSYHVLANGHNSADLAVPSRAAAVCRNPSPCPRPPAVALWFGWRRPTPTF
ncbi:extensin [Iris pallida]|uniref:Extensin n=1 Tax=Iris pallida TaxID=29817 RepID=A0AAX6H5C2_IRIPA|nr:extensin [Iris pallida]